MRTLKLMPDYGCYPIWEIFEDGADNLSHYNLPISDDLKNALEDWAEQYERTFDPSYPPNSAFSNKSEEAAFMEQGRHLWRRLKQELGEGYVLQLYER